MGENVTNFGPNRNTCIKNANFGRVAQSRSRQLVPFSSLCHFQLEGAHAKSHGPNRGREKAAQLLFFPSTTGFESSSLRFRHTKASGASGLIEKKGQCGWKATNNSEYAWRTNPNGGGTHQLPPFELAHYKLLLLNPHRENNNENGDQPFRNALSKMQILHEIWRKTNCPNTSKHVHKYPNGHNKKEASNLGFSHKKQFGIQWIWRWWWNVKKWELKVLNENSVISVEREIQLFFFRGHKTNNEFC